jgi:hypothetical protein
MSDAERRQEILDALAGATDRIALAIAALGEAYDHLDEHTADRLEADLFRPAQAAYGLAQRTHSAFAARHGLTSPPFAPANAPAAHEPRTPILAATEALAEADAQLVELQDSMLPVEYGDQPLREALAEVRRHLNAGRRGSQEIVRTLGR